MFRFRNRYSKRERKSNQRVFRLELQQLLLYPQQLHLILKIIRKYKIFQAKAYRLLSKLDTTQQETSSDAGVSEEKIKRSKKRNEFESETSTDEYDTDNEMTFIRNPNGGDTKHYNVDFSAGNMSFLGTLDADESDSDNENDMMDKLATAIGHLFTE